jgi:eukaryotic-like serine/threonine-protein kinase
VPTGTTISPPDSWTSRGDLVLSRLVPSADIVVLRNGEQTVRDLVATPYAEAFPALSPNERWLAYASNRTGRAEIWAMRYPDGNSVRVSNGGGIEPRWSRDGRELYFRQGDSMMAVAVNEDAEQPFSAVTKLFERPALMSTVATANSWTYDVASDGRFLMIDSGAPTDSAEGTIVVVQNWTEELKRRIARP